MAMGHPNACPSLAQELVALNPGVVIAAATSGASGKSPGKPSKLNDLQRRAIAGMIESGPIPAVPWRGALAADRSGAMDLRGIPHHDRQADAQPGAARHGLPQTLGPTAPPCASARRD